MDQERQKQIVEALLFLKEEPLRLEKIADVLELPREEARKVVTELQLEMARTARGIRIFEVAGGYQMGTLPELADDLERAFGEEGGGNLSNASLETIAIIAYKQPLTRAEIESIRGVNCDHVLENLLKRKLIKISGRKEAPGRPLIYCTTVDFLKYFGLKDLNELPVLEKE
jgi:segregation and condensation protein B